ncbi:hypothetical protein Tco_0712709 [Tanacetum coccineum]
MKAALATLGLTNGNNQQFTPSELINKSLLRIKYFSLIWGVLMLHIVKCLGEVNAHRAADKSLSRTAVQSSTQSKAPTNKKLRKKKIPSSSKPKTSTYVRHPKQKKPVAETQHTEESWATADIIESLDASKPAEEVRSQPETLSFVIQLGEVNPVHAYYNGSRTSKDNEDPGWNTSFKTRRTQKTTSAVEALWKTILRCYLYLLGTLTSEYMDGTRQVMLPRSSNHHGENNLLKIGMLVWGKLIQKLRQKGVYEESFSRHAAWIGGKLIQFMHTTMVPVQVKTMKIQVVEYKFLDEKNSEETTSPPDHCSKGESILTRCYKKAPGSDIFRFLMPDVDHEYSRLCKDLQHPAYESHTLRVLELHSAFGRTRDPSLHYKLTFSTIHLMQESENLKGDEHMEDDLMVTHTRIISLGFYDLDQIMQDDESDLESMPYDEIISISGDDDEVEDSDKEISPADEVDANKVIDEILTEINIEDLTQIIFAAPITKVSSVSDSKSTHVFQMVDVQELAAGALWKRRTFLVKNKQIPFGHLPRRMDFLVAHVHNLGKYVPDKIDSVVPRMIINALEERMPQNVRVKMGEVVGLFRQTAKHQMQLISYLEQVLHSIVKVTDDILVVNAKNLTSKVNRTLADMNELVGLVSRVVLLIKTSTLYVEHTEEPASKKFRVMIDIPTHVLLNFKKPIVFDNILFEQFLASLFGIGPSQYTPTPPPSKLDKGKGMISLLLQSSLTRLKMLGSIEWIELHKIAYRKQGAANDQLLKNLKAKFKWVASTTEKLNIPPPPQLIDFEVLPGERKRKRKNEVLKEVFILEDVVVDDMHRNLTLPQGITSVRAGQVIKEPEGFWCTMEILI